MNASNNNGLPNNFRTRLIVFALLLAVGFLMGWINGSNASSTSSGIIEVQQREQEEPSEVAPTSQDEEAPPADEDTDTVEEPSRNDDATTDDGEATSAPTRGPTVKENGQYTSKDEVALYIHTYGHLPSNFISKTKARNRGWVASEGNLDEVCPGMSIGGSRFYNDDGKLPDKRGRQWTECDINYSGGFRGAERIVFSNDGLVYYTGDHYETFERLY